MGDGLTASFGPVTKAVECAVALQRAFDDRNRGVGAEQLPTDDLNSRDGVAVDQPLRDPVQPSFVRVGGLVVIYRIASSFSMAYSSMSWWRPRW